MVIFRVMTTVERGRQHFMSNNSNAYFKNHPTNNNMYKISILGVN